MELYEPLPDTLSSCFKKEIPPAVILQLGFLWKALHEVCQSSLELSHTYSRKFLGLVDEHGVELPATHSASTRLCFWCGVIQLPGVTSSARLRPIKLKSRINRRNKIMFGVNEASRNTALKPENSTGNTLCTDAAVGAKLKNVMVCKCLKCGKSSITRSAGLYLGMPRLSSKASNKRASPASSISPDHESKRKKAFSFLELNKTTSRVGTASFSSVSNAAPIKTSGLLNMNSTGFVSFVAGNQAYSKSTDDGTKQAPTPEKVNLLELEKQKKKALKKAGKAQPMSAGLPLPTGQSGSFTQSTFRQNSGFSKPVIGSVELSSLKSLFKTNP